MEKISVTIRIPALDITHDFIIPSTMPVYAAKKLVLDILASEYGVENTPDDVSLFDKADGKLLGTDFNLEQLGIMDGAKLILL